MLFGILLCIGADRDVERVLALGGSQLCLFLSVSLAIYVILRLQLNYFFSAVKWVQKERTEYLKRLISG